VRRLSINDYSQGNLSLVTSAATEESAFTVCRPCLICVSSNPARRQTQIVTFLGLSLSHHAIGCHI
jgi:hypothetical protein